MPLRFLFVNFTPPCTSARVRLRKAALLTHTKQMQLTTHPPQPTSYLSLQFHLQEKVVAVSTPANIGTDVPLSNDDYFLNFINQ
ncbi:hypothetical protein B484DRAFT_457661 [Ochromonadaceae sp. CCMP2298]|nr:hypothetical protein B484DRAFT_457661 [Ochromonadaceae sp. CCMP2298]